ncbi:MAG: hypothetical protein V9E82_12880 [Candidatus Nanopelagicales bacterium]
MYAWSTSCTPCCWKYTPAGCALATRAQTLVDTIEVTDPVASTRHELARELVEDLRAIDARLADNQRRISAEIARNPTSLN